MRYALGKIASRFVLGRREQDIIQLLKTGVNPTTKEIYPLLPEHPKEQWTKEPKRPHLTLKERGLIYSTTKPNSMIRYWYLTELGRKLEICHYSDSEDEAEQYTKEEEEFDIELD